MEHDRKEIEERRNRTKITKTIIWIIVVASVMSIVATGAYAIFRYGKDNKRMANSLISSGTNSSNSNPLLVVSLDGFGYNYLSHGVTPNLEKLVNDENGISMRLKPQFPSYTFPNHYTLITGLLPQNHGIISNNFLDGNEHFNIRDSSVNNPKFWKDGEPIWNRIKKSNKKAAVIRWPGCNVPFSGGKPDLMEPFDIKHDITSGIDKALEWLPKANLTLLYYENIDEVGHANGPDHEKLKDALRQVDKEIGRLVKSIPSETNLIILSDHGMSQIKNRVFLEYLIPDIKNRVHRIMYGPIVFIYSKTEGTEGLYQDLVKSLSNTPIEVYKKENIPNKWRFKDNSRIPPIILVSPIGWLIERKPWNDKDRKSGGESQMNGTHGYDPDNPEMYAIFIAKGPDIKRASNFDKNAIIDNLDVNRLLCKLIQVDEPKDDGTDNLIKLITI